MTAIVVDDFRSKVSASVSYLTLRDPADLIRYLK
jgi:hypothetical protein